MALNITPASILSGAATGVNLLTSASKVDVIGVLDQATMQQLFPGFRPSKATVRETSRVMDYPVETGAILSDHKVINPTEIEMVGIITSAFYSSAYQAIRNAWLNSTTLSVQTRTGTYRNMIIADMPHEEDADMYDAVNQGIRFREVIFTVPSSIALPSNLSNFSPSNPVQSPTINRGLLSAIPAAGSALAYFRALSIWGF